MNKIASTKFGAACYLKYCSANYVYATHEKSKLEKYDHDNAVTNGSTVVTNTNNQLDQFKSKL